MIQPAFFTTSILPKPERLLLRGGRRGTQAMLRVRVGYLWHPKLGHTLIDTGYSAHVTTPGQTSDVLLAIYRKLIGPSILSPDPLAAGLARLNLQIDQIDTVILTHFHADHAGGLLDLPQARVICAKAAYNAVQRKSRIKNATEGVFASLLPQDLGQRLTFVDNAPLVDLPGGLGQGWDIGGDGTLLAVDLPGHLEGHMGLCFPTLSQPFLYAVDAQWMLNAVLEDRCPGLPASLVHHDGKAMQQSVARVREFAQSGGDVMLCHEPCVHRFDVDAEIPA